MALIEQPYEFLRRLLGAALDAADPGKTLPAHLPPPPKGRTLVIGAGKAAAKMAKAIEDHWPGPLSGLVVTRYGHAIPCRRIEVVEAAHPVPDVAGQEAAQRILGLVQGLTADDLVICLMSGGASALLALPAPGLSLEDKQAVTRDLLRSGATIAEINCVRKHLSAIKGGRLAAAIHPARLLTFAISDVPGDDPAVIGSGPTVPDPSTFAQARAILAKYGLSPPPMVVKRLAESADETPKPGDPRLAGSRYTMIAAPRTALEAAAALAREHGVTPVILGDAIEGEAREVALVQAALARQAASGRFTAKSTPLALPAVLLSGGETTVTVRGKGAVGAMPSFCWRLRSLLTASRASTRLPRIPMASTGRKATPERFAALTPWPAPRRWGSISPPAWPITMPGVHSIAWAICL